MTGAQAAADCGVWSVEGHSIRVEYSVRVLEDIRVAAIEGFNRVRHGGVEVGGILFGVRENARENEIVRILHHRPLPTEYATGPNFILSAKDRESLAKILDDARGDAELAGTICLGWYHTHTRSDISLSEADLDIYRRFFPEPWQVALVVRPSNVDPVRAGFFFREKNGTVHSQSPYREFTVQGPRPQGAVVWLPDEPPSAPPGDVEVATLPGRWLEPISSVPGPWERAALAKKSRRKRYAWGLTAIPILALGSFVWPYWQGHRASGVGLAASESGGLLHIQWDRNAPSMRSARNATIEIAEGGSQIQLPLNPEQLRKGSITYARQTEDVTIFLKIDRGAGEPVEELTRFVAPLNRGAAGKSADPEADRRKAELESEAASLRATMQQQNEQLLKMTQALNAMKTSEVRKAADARKPVEIPKQVAPQPGARQPSQQDPRVFAAQLPQQRRTSPDVPLPPPPDNVSGPVATGVSAILAPASPPLPLSVTPPARIVPTVEESAKSTVVQPSSGQLIWTGRLGKDGQLTIDGNHASSGSMTGALPGVPVRVRVYPADLTSTGIVLYTANPTFTKKVTEAPSVKNGWNRTVYTKDEKRAASVHVVESPGPQNGWKKLVLRGDGAKLSIVVMEWGTAK